MKEREREKERGWGRETEISAVLTILKKVRIIICLGIFYIFDCYQK